jgi:hypothetical protein
MSRMSIAKMERKIKRLYEELAFFERAITRVDGVIFHLSEACVNEVTGDIREEIKHWEDKLAIWNLFKEQGDV